MNHTGLLRRISALPAPLLRERVRGALPTAAAACLAMVSLGCFRATGYDRSVVAAEAIPEVKGDQVWGIKSMAGPGDYYLGNDFIQVAVDGTLYGDASQSPIAGAASGGSIVDAGYLNLDTSYRRVDMQGDSLERLTPVVNQDPDLEIVFDRIQPDSSREPATLTLTGRILDPRHKLAGAAWDAAGVVQGVRVTHVLSMAHLDRFVTLSTTVVNESGASVGIRNLADCLHQTTGGYIFNVPAGVTVAGEPLAKPWGVQISGSDFGNPIATSVQAGWAAAMASETSAAVVDSHASLGFMSLDAPTFIVASDPQDALGYDRPVGPNRLVVGSLPLPPAGLASGDSLSYKRALYIAGGTSASATTPSQAMNLWNQMATAKYNNYTDPTVNLPLGIYPQDTGNLSYTLIGSAMNQGPLPTEVRVERYAGLNGGAKLWIPERVEWLEPTENLSSLSSLSSSTAVELLPAGIYRLVITNALGQLVKDTAINAASADNPYLPQSIQVLPRRLFAVSSSDYLCPEAGSIVSGTGAVIRSVYSPHYFVTRPANEPLGSLQPLRFVFKGREGTPDPWVRRSRILPTLYSSITKAVALSGIAPGQTQVRAGNEMFGTAFISYPQSTIFWFANGEATGQLDPAGIPVTNGGNYRAYGLRGPLSDLQFQDFVSYNGQSDSSHTFIVWQRPNPEGWVGFDVPGPSQATGGGYLPMEKLASAMAEGVSVVGHTEKDLGTDGDEIYNEFTWQFNAAGFHQYNLTSINWEPFVMGARTSDLPGFGTATSLLTPPATRFRFGGALQPTTAWSVSDFMTQAQGRFTIINRPRGPQGLFTLQGLDHGSAAGQGANAWMAQGGTSTLGYTNGSFDAIELLRAEGFDGSNPDPWFAEFKQVRDDWFWFLNQQAPGAFTKALGLSSANFSLDTPVGLARTWVKATPSLQLTPTYEVTPTVALVQDFSTLLAALQAGQAVASTGPFLDVNVGGTGPGGLVPGPAASAPLTINLWHPDWMPVDEVRIVVNGTVVATLDPSTFTPSAADSRVASATVQVPLPQAGTGAWIVVEAGVPLSQTGPYRPGTAWSDVMRGIYPIAVTNPIFVDVTGHGYTHP